MGAETKVLDERTEIASRVLPIIDLSAARGNDSAAKRELADQLDRAFSSSGFCYITNYGVAQSVINDAFTEAAKFFHAPVEEKLKLVPTAETMFRGWLSDTRKYRTFFDFDSGAPTADTKNQSVGGKENYVFGAENPRRTLASSTTGWPSGPNPWPQDLPAFSAKSYTFFEEMQKVGADILSMLAIAMGVEETFFRQRYGKDEDTSSGVYAYYPSLTPAEVNAGKQSLPGHCDFSCLSLVVQHGVGGLQVQERGSEAWVDAPPLPGTIVANVGDLLARWSNDRYVSSLHRVMNTAGRERFSFILGYNPKATATIDPRELRVSDKDCRHAPILAGKYMWARAMETGATDEDIAAAKQAEHAPIS
jgi:isopenicillin N synthase-like dioxygenase